MRAGWPRITAGSSRASRSSASSSPDATASTSAVWAASPWPASAARTSTRVEQVDEALAYAQCRVDGVTAWGAGRDPSALVASVQEVLAAVNRAVAAR
ncbi:hypothetical protein [Streptomyces sp. NPDC055134]